MGNPYGHGTLLFDLETDPLQQHPIDDEALELRMAQLLVDGMRANEAPDEQYTRLGLPAHGDVGPEHLLVKAQWETAQRALSPAARRADFARDALINTITLGDLADRPDLVEALGDVGDALMRARRMAPRMTIIEALAGAPGPDLAYAQQVQATLEKATSATAD